MKPLTEPFVQIISAVAIVGQVFLAGMLLLFLASLFIPPAKRALLWLREGLAGSELWLAFVVALLATSGSLFFSEYSNFIPCHWCWLQRYAMYPLVPILLVAALLKRRLFTLLPLVVATVGVGIAAYHRYTEAFPSAASQGCRQGGGCLTPWLQNLAPFEYITIPTLALTAFALIILFLLLSLFPPRTDEPED